MKRVGLLILFGMLALLATACGGGDEPELDLLENEENMITTASGLQYVITKEGSGAQAQEGDQVRVHYTGTLDDGTVFDSSDGGDPIAFALGTGQVIAGWDEGIALLNEGGKAKLVIPSDLAYGKSGFPGLIPPDATLIFEVELVEIVK